MSGVRSSWATSAVKRCSAWRRLCREPATESSAAATAATSSRPAGPPRGSGTCAVADPRVEIAGRDAAGDGRGGAQPAADAVGEEQSGEGDGGGGEDGRAEDGRVQHLQGAPGIAVRRPDGHDLIVGRRRRPHHGPAVVGADHAAALSVARQLRQAAGEFGRVEDGVDALAGGAVLEEVQGGVEVCAGFLADLADGLAGHRVVDEDAEDGGDRAAHRRHGQCDLPSERDRRNPHAPPPTAEGDGVRRLLPQPPGPRPVRGSAGRWARGLRFARLVEGEVPQAHRVTVPDVVGDADVARVLGGFADREMPRRELDAGQHPAQRKHPGDGLVLDAVHAQFAGAGVDVDDGDEVRFAVVGEVVEARGGVRNFGVGGGRPSRRQVGVQHRELVHACHVAAGDGGEAGYAFEGGRVVLPCERCGRVLRPQGERRLHVPGPPVALEPLDARAPRDEGERDQREDGETAPSASTTSACCHRFHRWPRSGVTPPGADLRSPSPRHARPAPDAPAARTAPSAHRRLAARWPDVAAEARRDITTHIARSVRCTGGRNPRGGLSGARYQPFDGPSAGPPSHE